MTEFSTLKVTDLKKETSDTVSIAFDIPENLKEKFTYKAGQYLTIEAAIDGEDVRRSYSLCSSPAENEYRVAVKAIANGKMSDYLNNKVAVGDQLQVMAPMGNFYLDANSTNQKHYYGFAAGSGITPIISILKTVLKEESNSLFTLFYANKTSDSTIFGKELESLVGSYFGRLSIINIYTQQDSKDSLNRGRIDKKKARKLYRKFVSRKENNEFFLCGPQQMIEEVTAYLDKKSVEKSKIHFELFTATSNGSGGGSFSGESAVTVIMDGDETTFNLLGTGDNILDAAMDSGVDAPFSCKGAVCCTCKAKVLEGSAEMDMNYALSDGEVEDGFILTCQAHPTSDKLVIDYDVN